MQKRRYWLLTSRLESLSGQRLLVRSRWFLWSRADSPQPQRVVPAIWVGHGTYWPGCCFSPISSSQGSQNCKGQLRFAVAVHWGTLNGRFLGCSPTLRCGSASPTRLTARASGRVNRNSTIDGIRYVIQGDQPVGLLGFWMLLSFRPSALILCLPDMAKSSGARLSGRQAVRLMQ